MGNRSSSDFPIRSPTTAMVRSTTAISLSVNPIASSAMDWFTSPLRSRMSVSRCAAKA
jgi:hypothetical protein